MKSVFFRRLLIVMVMVMMLTTIAMALGCGVVGIKIYENITLEEMVPKAGTVADLVRELGYGHISREAFFAHCPVICGSIGFHYSGIQ